MVKFSLLSACLVLVAAGCTPSSPSTPDTSTGTGDQTGSGKPDASLHGPTPSAPLKDPATVEQIKKDKKESTPATTAAGNPNRVYQLVDLKKTDIKAAGRTVHSWIMDEEGKRAEGMMFLTEKDVKEDQGMIFVFPAIQVIAEHGFWMHNCPLGLDIVYIGKDKKVINVGDGVPFNEKSVPPFKDYFYVLEVRRGWSKRHGLKAGDTVGIPSNLKTNA